MLKKLLTLQCYKIKTTGITMLENKNYWHYNVRKTTYITMLENKNYLHYNVRKTTYITMLEKLLTLQC